MTIQDLMYDARRKLSLTHISMGIATQGCRMGVINVQLRDEQSGEIVHFGDAPTLLFHDAHGVYSGLLEDIAQRQNAGEPYYCLERLGNAAKLLCDFMRERDRGQYEENLRRIRKGLTYLENNLSENNSIEELAQMCALSAGSFRRLFFECKGMSPVDYRNSLRVRRAGELLASGKFTVCEAAEAVGFSDSRYFSRIFRRYTGMLPSQVRPRTQE